MKYCFEISLKRGILEGRITMLHISHEKTFVLLKMLSGFWNSAAVWSVCLRASGFVRVLWGVLLHRALFWMDLSQHVVWKSLLRVVLVLQVLLIWQTYRKFVLSQYLTFAACLSCCILFRSPSFPLTCYFSFSLCLTHSFFSPPFSFFHSLVLVLFFLFLSLAIPFLFSPDNYSWSGYLSLSFSYSLSLVLSLSLSLLL